MSDFTIIEVYYLADAEECFRSPPNMTKVLYKWGLRPILDRVAQKNLSVVFRNSELFSSDFMQ